MPRENLTQMRERAAKIEQLMYGYYGPGKASLDYKTPFQLTVAVVLSAQCTDAAVNKVTLILFAKYGTPQLMAQAKVSDVEEIIHSLGFFRAKAKNIVALAQAVMSDFDGQIPADINELQKLPGVGRKTANCVMCEAFKKPEGIAVDTHVFRIAHRLKFATKNDKTPQSVESKLMKLYPQQDWLFINHQWVHFGREFCSAKNPRCADCIIGDLCPSRFKV